LIAGVREDLAVKVFGDDFAPMIRAAGRIAGILRGIDGATNIKIEQVTGLPFLEIRIDKSEIARRGLSLSEVQDAIGIAVGGRVAGLVFEGDRRFQIHVRLSDRARADLETLENLPIVLPHAAPGAAAVTVPLRQLATFDFTEGPNQISRENGKRRVVVTAEVRGRDIGSLVEEAQTKVGEQVSLPAGYWLGLGRPVRELRSGAREALDRRASVLHPDLPVAAERARLRARCVAGFQRRAAGADRRHCRLVASRNAFLGLGGCRVHRLVRRRGPQWPGDADADPAID